MKRALSALVLAACTSSAPTPLETAWPHATAVLGCAPFDGPAVSLVLSQEPYAEPLTGPYLSISVYRGEADVLGHSFDFGPGDTGTGATALCPAGGGACQQAQRTQITFGPAGPTGFVDGEYRVTFADGSSDAGTFKADRVARFALCG